MDYLLQRLPSFPRAARKKTTTNQRHNTAEISLLPVLEAKSEIEVLQGHGPSKPLGDELFLSLPVYGGPRPSLAFDSVSPVSACACPWLAPTCVSLTLHTVFFS